LIDRFGDRALEDVKTADIEDFIADLKLPRVVNRQPNRTLSPASINRTFELLRHMMNWAIGREYLERSPFRRGTETLIRKQHEDNQRRRRLSEEEESKLLAVATPFLKSMIITALDTGMRHGEMLALRFGDVDWHDLRHEYASRLVERGVPLAQVRDLLGQASITTTERYDNQKLENLQAAVLKLESGKTFDVNDTHRVDNRIDDADKVSSFFQETAKVSGIDDGNLDQENRA